MPSQKVADSLESLGRALERLREGLELPEAAPLAVDGTIQRFSVSMFPLKATWFPLVAW
jgi:hypothetical protein